MQVGDINNFGVELLELLERKNKYIILKVKCTCKEEFLIWSYSFKRMRSCGCLKHKIMQEINKTHGMTNSDTYKSWVSMKKRCYYDAHPHYNMYGGKGINVCDRWLNSFENFLVDMGERPFKKAVLDRIDGTKGYCKENCRWTTQRENTRNSSRNLIIEGIYFYKITDVCLKYGINVSTIYSRFQKKHWSIDRCFNTPVKGQELIWPEVKKEFYLTCKVGIK